MHNLQQPIKPNRVGSPQVYPIVLVHIAIIVGQLALICHASFACLAQHRSGFVQRKEMLVYLILSQIEELVIDFLPLTIIIFNGQVVHHSWILSNAMHLKMRLLTADMPPSLRCDLPNNLLRLDRRRLKICQHQVFTKRLAAFNRTLLQGKHCFYRIFVQLVFSFIHSLFGLTRYYYEYQQHTEVCENG